MLKLWKQGTVVKSLCNMDIQFDIHYEDFESWYDATEFRES